MTSVRLEQARRSTLFSSETPSSRPQLQDAPVCEDCLAPYEWDTDGLRPGWASTCGCAFSDPDDHKVNLPAGAPFYIIEGGLK